MINAFQQLLNKDHFINSNSNILPLKDSKSRTVVRISRCPKNMCCINMPRSNKAHISMVSETTEGHKKICDQVIVASNNDNVDIYFVELKKTLWLGSANKVNGACEQIMATVPVLNYLVSMARIHYQTKQKVKYHYVIIAEREGVNMDKSETRYNKPTMIKYNGEIFRVFHAQLDIPFGILK